LNGAGRFRELYGAKHIAIPIPLVSVGETYNLKFDTAGSLGVTVNFSLPTVGL
jgi:hypothetical protein